MWRYSGSTATAVDKNKRKKSSSNRWRNNRPMTKIELKKASEPLSKYAQKARKDPVIVVKKGKPFAAVVPIRNADEETVSLSTNRKFLAIIERSRSRTKKEGAISSKELRRRLGLKKQSKTILTFREFSKRGTSPLTNYDHAHCNFSRPRGSLARALSDL